MLLSTIDSLPNKEIIEIKGAVFADIVTGANFIKDKFASIGDTLGGRISGYEKTYAGMRHSAIDTMSKSAQDLGANAIIGINFQINSLGKNNTILQLSAHGTAVVIK